MMEWVDWSNALERAVCWLDDVHWQISRGDDLQLALESLFRGLTLLHRKWDREEWTRFCLEIVRTHPLREVIHQCPYTRHGFEKPRGYAGDAVLIDYLYEEHQGPLSPMGRDIYHFLWNQSGPRSVRERRELLAQEIDATAERVHQPRILSVACGHLREAEHSRAVAEGHVGDFIAFDQDPDSLEVVAQQHPSHLVRPVCGTVRSILMGKTSFPEMDLIYSAGLYDYLSEAVASRLTRLLFGMLRPGGRLLVGNFATRTPDAGYLEAFMDWWLLYRDENQVRAFASEINPEEIASVEQFRDSVQNVIYMVLTRR
ncbi:class I SAM-dependent methyltransferase [Archangium minus]|uniref:Class I SAM-dependent methyltransferase n=1 Tax=Archangium minus TaxID=83450 RepID=A0ABY9XC28_9BACT|nr:class I SAM-dependent methyltransferase [Archangium violaceum]WNG52944.1 class I SAM-dependent methyltransferase [Archangium minus]